MRFVYHHRTAGRGGEGLHTSSVVKALRVAGHEVVVVSPPAVDPMSNDAVPLDKGQSRATGLGRIWKWVSRSCPQPVFEVFEIGYNAYAAVRLAAVLLRGGDVILYERYAFLLFAGVWIARLFGRPVILEVNEVSGVKRARPQSFTRLTRWVERFIFSRADEILTVSTFLQREILKRGGRPGAVHVLPNAIDPARFARPMRREAVRTQLGIVDARVIGFVGWFDRWDRLDRLIELVDQLRAEHGDVRLLLVGDGPVANELREAAAARGLTDCVLLTGPVPRADVPDYISAMDICVLPDSNEFGSPIVLFEFMALGKPVIAPDVQPVRDAIEHGVTGLIVGRADIAPLKAAVVELLGDSGLSTRLGEAARQRVLDRHTWRSVAASVARLAHARVTRTATMDVGVGV